MTRIRTLDERTVQPPTSAKGKSVVDRLAKALQVEPGAGGNARGKRRTGRPKVVVQEQDRTTIEVPEELYDVIKQVVDALSRGHAVVVEPLHAVLTTQEAADKLHISRPTLIKLLEAGKIPYTTLGRHRRVLLADLLEYEQSETLARKRDLDQLSYDAARDGTADQIDTFVDTR